MHTLRIPLVSVSRTKGSDGHTHLEYFVDDLCVLDMDILSDYVPYDGPLEKLPLVQLLVTPHEHISILSDVLSYARAGKVSGPEWDSIMNRIESVLSPPS